MNIATIKVDKSVRIKIDVYPDRTLTGKVSSVRLDAVRTNNLVQYAVMVDVDNADQKLLPYLTVNVEFWE